MIEMIHSVYFNELENHIFLYVFIGLSLLALDIRIDLILRKMKRIQHQKYRKPKRTSNSVFQ